MTGSSFAGFLAVRAALVASGCGGSGRQLQSVTLGPPTADAKNFPNGQIPFVAIGMFSSPPSPVTLTSKDVVWCFGDASGVCAGNIAPSVIVDQNGLAQCGPTFVGTATVLTGIQSSMMANPDGPQPLRVFGSAQVSCP
jgi:hypothetical protein